MRPILSITFLQGFRISKKFGHLTLGSGGKKTFKRTEQMQKKICKNFFCSGDFLPFMSKSFQIWDHFITITFPQWFRKSKMFGHWTMGSGGKKTVKQSKKHRYQKKSCSVRQNSCQNKLWTPSPWVYRERDRGFWEGVGGAPSVGKTTLEVGQGGSGGRKGRRKNWKLARQRRMKCFHWNSIINPIHASSLESRTYIF